MAKAKDETKPKREPPKTIQVPRELYADMRSALRSVGRDTRRADRQLTDDTRTKVENVIDKTDDHKDKK